ncbi:hypothetical protein BS47DRAFT_1347256 [Hydnum rufescens UP504]|uniref:Formamidase n=1 Tax=Hydnum rufescens UP504 TaxID=1448309 RepID=A0A9P6DUS9_9AGAM|nr:hypothetical protein BS47DRAFT_1347256 [Hydnum rufescens UP504]
MAQKGGIPTVISVLGMYSRTLLNWHPDIPSFVAVTPGQAFKVECLEWTGGQILNTDNADDIHNVDLSRCHNLSGPIEVVGAEPGDILVVDILDVQPFAHQPWGYTGIFDLHNGGGLFASEFDSKACKAVWDFEGIYATSRHIPGVKFAGVSHPGLIGCAPDPVLLAKWNERERALIAANKDKPKGTYVGGREALAESVLQDIAVQGARTIPPREHGGNVDIKNLSRGSKVYFPVYVKGAKLSVGDLHFSQGDGEMSFCGAIEMPGIITLKTSILKNGVSKFGQTMPMFKPSPIDPIYSDRIIFEGISVDLRGDGAQYNMDATVAYKQAALNCIEYLVRLGYSREQAYLLLSAAPVDSHVAGLVDSPNACVTMSLPVGIFDFDINPTEAGLKVRKLGECATSRLPRARG